MKKKKFKKIPSKDLKQVKGGAKNIVIEDHVAMIVASAIIIEDDIVF